MGIRSMIAGIAQDSEILAFVFSNTGTYNWNTVHMTEYLF